MKYSFTYTINGKKKAVVTRDSDPLYAIAVGEDTHYVKIAGKHFIVTKHGVEYPVTNVRRTRIPPEE